MTTGDTRTDQNTDTAPSRADTLADRDLDKAIGGAQFQGDTHAADNIVSGGITDDETAASQQAKSVGKGIKKFFKGW